MRSLLKKLSMLQIQTPQEFLNLTNMLPKANAPQVHEINRVTGDIASDCPCSTCKLMYQSVGTEITTRTVTEPANPNNRVCGIKQEPVSPKAETLRSLNEAWKELEEAQNLLDKLAESIMGLKVVDEDVVLGSTYLSVYTVAISDEIESMRRRLTKSSNKPELHLCDDVDCRLKGQVIELSQAIKDAHKDREIY